MTRAVTLTYEDAVLIAEFLRGHTKPGVGLAISRFADALDEAEAPEPSGLFPEPVIIGPSGVEYRVRSRAEDTHD